MNHSEIVRRLLAWYRHNARPLPWRRTRDPYAIWVSEIMLQQTKVKTVVSYWERWMRALPDIEALAAAPAHKLHKLWEGLGYYTRVRNLQRAAQVIQFEHGGRFPLGFDAVLALPGIGRYTAGAICSIAYNQPEPILDGNVMRVLARLYGISGDPREGKTNARFWDLAHDLVKQAAATRQPRACSHFNQSLMELGALICTPKQPQCGNCPVVSHCVARRRGIVDQLPHRRQRVPAVARRFAAFVAQRDGRFLVRQRPAGVVNAHLWEFPNVEVPPGGDPAQAARQLLGAGAVAPERLITIKHSITRYRITLEAYRVTGQRLRAGDGQWLSAESLHALAFTSAHRRVLRHVLPQP